MPPRRQVSRAQFLRGAAALGAALGVGGAVGARASEEQAMQTRPIPSSGAALPVIGLGTWRGFDVGSSAAERAPLKEVLRVLFAGGGTLIDSSPMYGRAEQVAGDLLAESGSRGRAFLATKVWTTGRQAGLDQMTRSLKLLRTDRLELLQIHNLVDWRTHLPTLREWKRERRIQYLGITHYSAGGYAELEAVMRAEPIDFVQLNYAVDDRGAEARLLPLAADRGVAVLVNLPFGGGGLLRALAGKPLPAWAGEIGCGSWAQLLLKFVLAHPAVTCVIPGTANPAHLRDNLAAGSGPLPDAALRAKLALAVAD